MAPPPTDVPSQHVLNLLLLVSALDDQSPRSVDTAAGSQLGEQELRHVLVAPLHALADLGDVGEDGLLVAFT